MDPTKFDELTKALATSTSRRQALKTIAATTLGSIFGLSGIGVAFAKCKGDGHPCSKDEHCCSGLCSNRTCCPASQVCNGVCCAASQSCCPGGFCLDICPTTT